MYHNIPNIKTCLLACCTLLFFTTNIFAASCEEISPNYVGLKKETYFSLEDNKALSTEELEKLSSFLSNVEGKWKGQIITMECYYDPTEKIYQTYDVTANIITFSDSSLEIEYDRYSIEEKFRETSDIRLFVEEKPVFKFNFLNSNHLQFSEKFRRASGVHRRHKTRSSLVEYIYDLEIAHRSFSYNVVQYINGVFATEETWTLSR